MDDFIVFILTVAISGLALIGVVMIAKEEILTPQLLRQAEVICRDNGGVRYVELDLLAHDVHCNSGAVFGDSIDAREKSDD